MCELNCVSSRVLRLEASVKRGAQHHQLTLVHACKPHSKAVSGLAIDREGRILASGVSQGVATAVRFYLLAVSSLVSVMHAVCLPGQGQYRLLPEC